MKHLLKNSFEILWSAKLFDSVYVDINNGSNRIEPIKKKVNMIIE